MMEIFKLLEKIRKSKLFKYIEERTIQLMKDENIVESATVNSCMVVILKTVVDSIHGQLPDFLVSKSLYFLVLV